MMCQEGGIAQKVAKTGTARPAGRCQQTLVGLFSVKVSRARNFWKGSTGISDVQLQLKRLRAEGRGEGP
ncbi:unnamed protein product [Caenorhabditis auriculariae]|uniref:Uncharacterized protein n=1 Tax=Caenorhabditis auriculariae TaxID=2777116 RepID=A0A8S1HAX3_9PELO|nr:unnamed protein product [Caenorhabditis auriculariae]